MNAAIVAFSQRGSALGERLAAHLTQSGHAAVSSRCPPGGLAAWVKEHFDRDALVFIGSCGIAVRGIAPYVKSKTSDPAVVVVDELGSFSIPILSGHIGGANELAVDLARFLGAIPVVTTATDRRGVFAVDTWAVSQGLRIANPQRIKWISARLLAGESIALQSSVPVQGPLPEGITLCDRGGDVLITHRTRGRKEALRLVPPVVTLGIGCRKGVAAEEIDQAFALTLAKAGCHPLAVARVCSINLKAAEPGILAFCHSRGLSYKTFSPEALMAVPGQFSASAFVRDVTGADNVCERAAVLGSGEGGRLLTHKDAGNGVTMALAIAPCTITFEEQKT